MPSVLSGARSCWAAAGASSAANAAAITLNLTPRIFILRRKCWLLATEDQDRERTVHVRQIREGRFHTRPGRRGGGNCCGSLSGPHGGYGIADADDETASADVAREIDVI